MTAQELPEHEKDVLRKYADSNMNASDTARKMWCHRNTVLWRLGRIREKTGLDPRRFHDLVRLLGELGEESERNRAGGEANHGMAQ